MELLDLFGCTDEVDALGAVGLVSAMIVCF